jgi:predicted nucleic acid-binding Zn ribbon protein
MAMRNRPVSIADVLAELMARKGFARVQSAQAYEAAWVEAAGEMMAEYTRVGSVRRGVLEVIVANSTLLQELVFQKQTLVVSLNEQLPDEGIRDLRFRVGAVS